MQELGGLLGDHNSEKAKCVNLQVRSGRLVTVEIKSTPVPNQAQWLDYYHNALCPKCSNDTACTMPQQNNRSQHCGGLAHTYVPN